MKKSIFLFFAAILCSMSIDAYAATQRYIYVGLSNNYHQWKNESQWGINHWGGTGEGVVPGSKITDLKTTITHSGCTFHMYRMYVYDDNKNFEFKGNDGWWDCKKENISISGTTKNAILFRDNDGGDGGNPTFYQTDYQEESTVSLSASSNSVSVGEEVTLTPKLTSNAEYNEIASTTYSVGTGATVSDGKFVATTAGTYTVTATITYNPKKFTGITKKVENVTCEIVVSEVAVPHPVTGVTVAPTSVTIKQGATATLTATVSPSNADDPSITWSSDNTSVATVVNGVVTAVAAGTANITVTTVDGGFTATCAVKVKPSQYTFYAINSAQWPTVAAHYWGGADGGSSWPGADMVKESETINGFDIYSITISSDFINIMFTNQLNGDDKNKKTADLTTEGNNGKYYDIKGAKWYASLSDIPAPVEDYYTVVGVAELFGSAWSPANEANKMVKQGDGSYKLVKENVTLAAIGYDWKIAKNGDWWNDAATGVNPAGKNNTLTITTAGRYNVTFTLAADLKTAKAETELLEAVAVIPDCFISGNKNLTGKETEWQGNEFTMVYDEATETWSYTLAGLQPEKAYELKVVCGGTWYNYTNLASVPTGVTEGNDHSITFKMAEAGDVTVTYNVEAGITLSGNFAEPVTYDYYLTGTLVGGWSATQQGMEKEGDVYKHTFSELNAKIYEFKITDGQFNSEGDNTHEHTTLGAAYEEVSYNNGNIQIITEDVINLTVIFNAATDKITFDGLTPVTTALTYKVKVPAGTDECYIAGPCNSWDFRQMTREGTTDVFTIDIVGAKETDEYKYACQADWAYAEVIEGGGNRTEWSALDEVTAWNAPAEPVEMASVVLLGVEGDWTTGIEMELNPTDANEYMLLCQSITADEPIKIKAVDTQATVTWCAKLADTSLGTVVKDADGNDNIVLEEGKYDFYYKVAEKEVWIGTCTETEEIGDITELTMTNLVVTPMDGFDLLEASENTYGISVTLGVDAEGNLINGSNVTMYGETDLPINYNLSGKFTKSTDEEYGDVYSGLVVVEFGEGLMGLQLTMFSNPIEVTEINITEGTVTFSESGAYVMSAKWDNEDVMVELTALELEDWVSILIGDRVLSGNATVTNQDGVVTLEAKGLEEYNEEWTQVIAIYDITITATLDLQNVTVYFINTPKWNTSIYAYATKKTGWGRYQEVIAENAPSPGEVATKEDYQIAGYDVYSYTALEGTYNSVQFSGNEMATDEAGWESDMYYIHNFDGNSGWYTKADAETLLTPQVELTEITLTSGDNSALLAAADGKTVDVTVERSFTAGGLHTIALPFKLTNVAGVFGEGTVVYEFAELQLENNDLALYFDTTKTTIEAGKPYLIVPAQSVNGFEVDDATISAAPQPISFTVGNATVTMEPVLTVATNAKTNGKYWLASDTYLYNTSTALKSLCAVFDIQSQKSNVRARIAFNENAATGFDNIVAPEGQTIKAIVNGQLVIIRGGEMYNVQGQKL